MPEITTASETPSVQTLTNTPGAEELIKEAATQLETNDSLALAEGTLTGALYAETKDGVLRVELQAGRPTVVETTTLTEETQQLMQIEPSETESIESAANSVVYTGGD